MSSASIESLIKDTKTQIANAKSSQRFYVQRYDTIISELEQQLDEQLEELKKMKTAEKPEPYLIGTKLKWVSSVNEDTYCVAIVTKKGILEVKNVFEGGGLCHNTQQCSCKPCGEIRLSKERGVPWRPRAPLIKTLFATEEDWLKTLHADGKLSVTRPPVPLYQLRKLMHTPLTATTDVLKLKELELRFPGAKFTCRDEDSHISSPYATGFGGLEKPKIMAEWRGARFQLSHLF
jgi:hypothetical protein